MLWIPATRRLWKRRGYDLSWFDPSVCLLTLVPYLQTVIALDLYLAYLRATFNTCYYCAVITDHVEELQRKCVKHLRKPMSKMLLQEVQAAEASKADKEPKVEEGVEVAKERDASTAKERENRDWKRNGMFLVCLIDATILTFA